MAKPYAKSFYNSSAWLKCRASYISKVHGLCESCLARAKHIPGYIVDHIEEISQSNIDDPYITLNHENLQYLCLPCHNTKTFGADVKVIREGLTFDADGNIVRSE